jgi:hypothetical protein
MGITTRLRWASVGVAAAAALLAIPGAAQAAGGGGGGEAFGSATNGLFTLRFHVYEHGADPHNVSGWVEVQPNASGAAGAGRPASPKGRLTCVDIEGNQVGAVYVPDPADVPPAFRGQALFATGVDSGPGGQDKMGFVAGPPSRFPTCRPTFTVPNTQVIQGDLTVRPAS